VSARLRVLPLLLSGALLFGCGASDEDKVRDRVTGLYDAFADEDAKKVCESLTQEQREITAKGAGSGGSSEQSCEQVMSLGLGFLKDALKDAGNAEVTKVQVKGNRARATVKLKGNSPVVGLEKEDGEWLVSDFNLARL